jgi:toxin ParE1/3/4
MGERFADRILDRCEQLASVPGTMGRPRPELRPDLRSVSFKGYVIFFRYIGDVPEVVNVLEGHRDIDAYFDEGA